jgi:DNA-binding NtrC family response regulator
MDIRLLIIEDDAGLSQMLSLHFEDLGARVEQADNCAAALQRLEADAYDLVLLDQQLPDGLGLDLLLRIRERQPDQSIIMMTGQHDLELAIEAIKSGAAEFIHKPIQTDELQQVVDKVLQAKRLADQANIAAAPQSSGPPRELIGKSAAMLAVSKEIALCARSQASVLITGESGVGKEVVARLIHQHSGRTGAFVALNCAAIVDSLLESELFGHEKGAFTGAASRKSGKIERAQGGTLFLDEVGELAPPLQAKLLRALQEKVYERVGGAQTLQSDARILAATNRDLFAEARNGRFREDLIYRLRVVQIELPALRKRKEDIPLLVNALLDKIAGNLGVVKPLIAAETLKALSDHDWPGNVRELENVLTQAAIHARNGTLTPDLITQLHGSTTDRPAPEPPNEAIEPGQTHAALRTLEQVEAEHIQKVLDHTGGHKGNASKILDISRPALDRKIKKYALQLRRYT